MKRIGTLAAAASMLVASVATEPWAQVQPDKLVNCGSLKATVRELVETFKERPLVVGNTLEGFSLLLMLNPETGTWTLLLVSGDRACILVAGTGMRPVPSSMGERGA
jgi:hypothetical protein